MENYIIKNNKKLRIGYTTGTCAAASAKAAAFMLINDSTISSLKIDTLKGITFDVDILDIKKGPNFVSCAVKKDGGDDVDATHGMLIYAKVELTKEKGIKIEGGQGIGIVTKKGLDQEVGMAAINSTPRKVIAEEVQKVFDEASYTNGAIVTIYAPEGEEVAKKTFNSKLGIVGGISILGTTGIVEPMSDEAIKETIKIEVRMRKENGEKVVLFTPGNYGEAFIKNELGLDSSKAILCSNFIGDAVDYATYYGFKHIILIGHIGKLVKMVVGMMNTHSKYGDPRKEIFTSLGLVAGLSSEGAKEMMSSVMSDDMLDILEKENLKEVVMKLIVDRIMDNINHILPEDVTFSLLIFSNKTGILGYSSNFKEEIKLFGE